MLARCLALALVVGLAAPAQAQRDFDPEHDGWNGMADLIAIAGRTQVAIELRDRLDIGTVQANDALLVIAPRNPLPARAVTDFLRAGGRMALADDFGAGTSLLETFDIRRGTPSPEGALQLRSNRALLVARPRGVHPLTRRVAALVTNHPAMLDHPELAPVFELAEGEAVVLAGAVGDGRLVAVSDPSLLINNMLQFRANARFAENLLKHLHEGGGRLFLLGPDAELRGRFGEPGADRPLHDVRKALEQFAEVSLPPAALQVLSALLIVLAVLWAAGTLPRRSPYRGERMFAPEAAEGGFAGRLAFFGSGRVSLLHPLLSYKVELEQALIATLGLPARASLKSVLEAARAQGLREADVRLLDSVLKELDRLNDAVEQAGGPPRVGERRFRELVGTGERLLAELDAR